MSDPLSSLRGAVKRFQPPVDWLRRIEERRRRRRRNERIAATVVGLTVFGVILSGITTLSPGPDPEVDRSRPSEPTTVDASLGAFPVVYRDGFDDVDSGWPQIRRGRFEAGYATSEYRIAVLRPFENRWWVREVADSTARIEVRVRVQSEQESGSGWVGVMCYDPIGPKSGYGFLVNEGSGAWRIVQIIRLQRGSDIQILDEGVSAGIGANGGDGTHLQGRCEVLSQGIRLTIIVEGVQATIIDDVGPKAFVGVGMFLQAGANPSTARFDDLAVGTA